MKLKKDSQLLSICCGILGFFGYNSDVNAERLNCICTGNDGQKIVSHSVTSNVTSTFKSCADFVGTAGAKICVPVTSAKSK